MYFYPFLLFVALPMVAVSLVVALLPLRRLRLQATVLGLHVLVSLLLIGLLDGPAALWALILGPGLLVAATRLALTLIRKTDRATPA